MIISHKFQTVFIHIPKCAGTSIRNMLAEADPQCVRMWGWRWMERHQRYGDSAHMALIDLMPAHMAAVRDYTTVTLSRDPRQRFLSAVNQHLDQHKYRTPRTPSEILHELTSTSIRYDPAYIHFCPQHYFIYTGKKRHVNHVLRIEDPQWVDQLKALLVFQGFPESALHLPELNQSTGAVGDTLSDDDLRRLYQLYKRDYSLLGYTPPIEEDFVLHADEQHGRDRPYDFSSYDEVNLMGARFRKMWPNP